MNLREAEPVSEAPGYRLYIDPAQDDVPVIPSAVLRAIQAIGPLYIEVRRGVLLAFSPARELEDGPQLESLAKLAKEVA